MKHKKNILVTLLIKQPKKPLLITMLVMLLELLLYGFFNEFHVGLPPAAQKIKFVLFVLLILWYFLDVISLLNRYLKKESKAYKIDYSVMLTLSKIVLVIISVLVILRNFGADITGMLTFGGVSGVVAGLAAREFLANMFGFVTIVMDRAFKIGDAISSPDKKISGVVESIGLRCTKIMTHKKRMIYVPNALFSTIIIQNDSNASVWHINERIALSCFDARTLNSVISEIKQYLMQSAFVNKSLNIECNLDAVGSGSFVILVSVFVVATGKPEYSEIKEKILLQISNIVCSFGGKIVFYGALVAKLTDDAEMLCSENEGAEE